MTLEGGNFEKAIKANASWQSSHRQCYPSTWLFTRLDKWIVHPHMTAANPPATANPSILHEQVLSEIAAPL